MKSLISLVVLLAAIASVCLQVDGRGLMKSDKLDYYNEVQWIDNFLKDGASCDRINKHVEENRATMEPKMLAAFKLITDAACLNTSKIECSESESMKFVHLFNVLNIDIDRAGYQFGREVNKLAVDARDLYIESCSKKYSSAIDLSLSKSVDSEARDRIQEFAAKYGDLYWIREKEAFKPFTLRKLATKGFIGEGMMGKAVFSGVRYAPPKQNLHLNSKTGREEFNWLEVVDTVKSDCRAYVDAVKGPLEPSAKDAIVARTLELSRHSWQIFRSWLATIACEQLNSLDAEKVAKKLATEAANFRRV